MFTRVAEDKSYNLMRVDLLGIQRAQVFGSRGHYPVVAGVCVRSLGRGEKFLFFVRP